MAVVAILGVVVVVAVVIIRVVDKAGSSAGGIAFPVNSSVVRVNARRYVVMMIYVLIDVVIVGVERKLG